MHYRETVVWTKAMDVARRIYQLAALLPRSEMYGMRSQLTRSAVSVPCNIAEGWTRETPRDKMHFLAIAHGSLAELETQLTLCEQLAWFPMKDTLGVRESIEEVSRILTTLRRQQRSRSQK